MDAMPMVIACALGQGCNLPDDGWRLTDTTLTDRMERERARLRDMDALFVERKVPR